MADLVRSAIAAQSAPMRILGPAPAPVARLKGSFRFHFQLSAVAWEDIQLVWRAASDALKTPANVEFAVDMDPINLR
jgi:primosomal protein N' (replication factor Y)